MQGWQRYQEEAADFFRSVGLGAATDVRVEGARSWHNVDVLVDFERAGMAHQWIVECKAHRRAISKDRVHVLRDVVADLGADRGILLSESGFQAGAVEAAQLTNVSLASLVQLRTTASDEVLDVALDSLLRRVRAAKDHVSAHTVRVGPQSWKGPALSRSVWPEGVVGLVGRLELSPA